MSSPWLPWPPRVNQWGHGWELYPEWAWIDYEKFTQRQKDQRRNEWSQNPQGLEFMSSPTALERDGKISATKKYRGPVPKPADPVYIAREISSSLCTPYAAVVARTDSRHRILGRMQAGGVKFIPNELILAIFRQMFKDVQAEMRQESSQLPPGTREILELINKLCGWFKSARLQELAYTAYRESVIHTYEDCLAGALLTGLDAEMLYTHFNGETHNVLNLCFDLSRIEIERAFDYVLPEADAAEIRELCERPRDDSQEVLKIMSIMPSLRSVVIGLGDLSIYGGNCYDTIGSHVETLVKGEYKGVLQKLTIGLQQLQRVGNLDIKIEVEMELCGRQVLSTVKVDPEVSADDICQSLLRPFAEAAEHTRGREEHEASEEDRLMSDP